MPLQSASPVLPVKPTPKTLDNKRGVTLMACGFAIFAAVDAQAKFLTETLHPMQVVWSRQLGLLVCVAVLFALRGRSLLATEHPRLQVTRGAMAACSAALFIYAVSYVPLADAVAITFVAPFMVTLLGATVLKEKVGIRRWSAVAVGFIGTLIVLRPGLGVVHPAAGLLILAAVFFSLRQIISRMISDTDRSTTTLAYTAVVGCAILTIPVPFVWQWPQTGTEITLLVTFALMAAGAEFLIIRALEIAEAAVLAPVMYTLIVWGTIYGLVIFGDLPDGWTWLGTAIIIASGLYTLARERKRSAA